MLHLGSKIHNQNLVSILYLLQNIKFSTRIKIQKSTFHLYRPTTSNHLMRINIAHVLIRDVYTMVFGISHTKWLFLMKKKKNSTWTLPCYLYNGKIQWTSHLVYQNEVYPTFIIVTETGISQLSINGTVAFT